MQQYDGAAPRDAISLQPRLVVDAVCARDSPEHEGRDVGRLLSEPFARHTAERVRALAPRRLLETACGAGLATRRLREVMPAGALLVATDVHESALAMARRTVGAATDVEWARADMCQLDFADSAFDAVVCQFGVMFMADRRAAMHEARRVLRRRGTLLLATWASLDDNPVVHAAHHAIAAAFPDDPPQHLARTPFGLGDPEAVMDLLIEAGFGDVVVDVIERPAPPCSARDLASELVEGSSLIDELRRRDGSRVPAAIEAAAAAIARQFGDRPVRARIAAVIAAGVA